MHVTPEARPIGSVPDDPHLALHWLLPLHFFYERRNLDLPELDFIDGVTMPEGDRGLLVHENDMTPTLAAFHHSKLYLEVHEHERTDNYLMRLVTLHAESDKSPVEYGAIGIHLDLFPEEVSQLIIEGEIPLGGILGEYGVKHSGSPTAFFSVPADQMIAEALHQQPQEVLYGRCNQLLDDDGMAIADIVEILPRHCESEKWIENVK